MVSATGGMLVTRKGWGTWEGTHCCGGGAAKLKRPIGDICGCICHKVVKMKVVARLSSYKR